MDILLGGVFYSEVGVRLSRACLFLGRGAEDGGVCISEDLQE